MILFVPAYDESTRANLAIAKGIAKENCILLLEKDATSDNLKVALQHQPVSLFAMTHGMSHYFCDNHDLPALSLKDAPLLSGKSAYVFACFTANHFGKTAAQENAIYWGYTGAIQSPDCQVGVAGFFQAVFGFIFGHFALQKAPAQIQGVLQKVKNQCEEALNALDLLLERNPELDLLEANLCLLHVWSRLRVYHPGSELPLLHPEAAPSELLE